MKRTPGSGRSQVPNDKETPPQPPPPTNPAEVLAAYRQMLSFLFFATLTIVILTATPLIWVVWKKPDVSLPILAYVALSGCLGAFFSALSRLYSLKQLPAALLSVDFRSLRNHYLLMYSLIPPIVGIIGAVFFYVVIASGLIHGDLFQHFKCYLGDDKCNSLNGLLEYGPEKVEDYAKSLVWGFVSGFSERLVPDTLSSLEKKAAEQ
jgi:hypothetical protein